MKNIAFSFSFGTLLFLATPVVAIAATTSTSNNGTRLTAVADEPVIECLDYQRAMVELNTTVTTSGSVDSAEILAIIDGQAPRISGWVEPQDFKHDQRYKSAVVSFAEVFANGAHTVQSCYNQSGSDGRTLKRVCAQTVGFNVSCAPENVCLGMAAFGNVIGNGNLCSGQAIPIHVKGDFGEGGTITISKGLFSTTIPFNRAGESCVYQAQYRPNSDGNAGAGSYTFTLTGTNNATYSFVANLKCR